MKTPSISLCMIVKNEKNWIATSILSVKDLVSEVVVVDTGSSDGTPDIARALGAKVIHFPWVDDFSAARNRSIAGATGEWILVLDADEIIDTEGCQQIRAWLSQPVGLMASMIQTTYSNEPHLLMWQRNNLTCEAARNFPGYIESPLIRLFKRRSDICFMGRVHEGAIWKGHEEDRGVSLDVRIHHYGQVRREVNPAKKDLYLKLGAKKVAENPGDVNIFYDYAVANWEAGHKPQAKECFRIILKISPRHLCSNFALAVLCAQTDEPNEAESLFRLCLEIDPCHISSLLYYSNFLQHQNRLPEAVTLLEKAHQIDSKHPKVLARLGLLYRDVGLPSLALTFLRQAAHGHPGSSQIVLNIGSILLQLNKSDEALKVFKDTLRMVGYQGSCRTHIETIYREHGVFFPQELLQESL